MSADNPQTKEELDAYIAAQVEAQRAKAQADIDARYQEAHDKLQGEVNAFVTQEKTFSDQVAGFSIGAIAPLVQAGTSTVNVADPTPTGASTAVVADTGMGIFGILLLGGLAYLIFRRG